MNINLYVFLAHLLPLIPGHPQGRVVLVSKLPADPIESPEAWAWGQHPDKGLDYKAKNGLTLEQCVLNARLAETVLCLKYASQASVVQCRKNRPARVTNLCRRWCGVFGTCARIPKLKN